MQISGLFPVPVYKTTLERPLNKREINSFINLETYDNVGNRTSIDKYILEKSELLELKTFIVNHVNDCFRQIYQPKFDLELYITQSWVNYTSTGNFHHTHTHSNSFFSGVFYIDTTVNDKITFSQPLYQAETFKIISKEYNIWNSDTWWLPARKNSLIIFPSTLHHSVGIVEDENHTRVSLSFNTFLKGQLGEETELNLLKLQ